MRSDMSLIHAARRGDGAAFAALVDRYANVLFRFALRYVSNPQAAQELAHDALVDFYRNMDRYEPRAALATYLCAIVSNKAKYAERKRRRSPKPMHEMDPQANGPSPVEQALRDEDMMRLKTCVDGLIEPLRTVVELRFMEGLKVREVADALGLPVGTVKSRLFAAMRILRGKMIPGGDQ